MSCRETKCANELAIYIKQQSKIAKQITKLGALKRKSKLTDSEYNKRVSKVGNSAIERKAIRDNLQCGLRQCFSEYKKVIQNLLKRVDMICKMDNRKEECDKVKEIRASLKNGMISVEQYAWFFKFLHNVELKI